jgi:transposase
MNTSQESKSTTLVSILQQQFSDVNKARIRFISLFIIALCKVKTVNYDRLASGFDTKVDKLSSYRRIQRFMSDFDLPMKLISQLIFSLLPKKKDLILVLDRTNWKFGEKNINILMLGVSYKNVAIPLIFIMLNKRGNSDTKERIYLLNKYIEWFGIDTIDCLLADREFIGAEWLKFLTDNNIRYHIRSRNNFKVLCHKKNEEIPVFWLFNHLMINEFYHYPRIVQLHGQLCYLSGKKTFDRNGKIEFLIIISFNKPEESTQYYKERWQIETLFKSLKSSGFNIEDTHVTDLVRLERLFSLVLIAFIWCYNIGDFADKHFKNIITKSHNRRAVSVFKHGLDLLSKYLLTNYNNLNINFLQFLSCT